MYALTPTGYVLRLSDNAQIPPDPSNTDWQEFVAWRDAGGVPLQMPTPDVVNAPPQITEVQAARLIAFLKANPDILAAAQL